MLIKKSERVKFENSPRCYGFEYPMNDKNINIAYIEIRERYPDKGFVLNEVIKEIVLVLNGKGSITIEGKKYILEKDDAFLILPNKKYFFEGDMDTIVTCSPAFYPEQHKLIP